MKRTLSMIAFAVLTIGLLGSCSKINERLDNLEKEVSGIENEQIASINSQIDGIKTSIADLGTIRSDISSLKQSASDHSVDIFNLEEADRALADRIVNLEDYVDAVLPNYAEKEWVEATFSTLEQYEATCDTIAKIDARIGALDTKLSKDIKACADSLTKWVNNTFEGYYTAAEMDASLAQMKSDIDSARAANKISDAKADSIAGELAKVKPEVDTVKANIRAEYKAAVKAAIEESEGKLTKKITDKITTVNTAITNLTKRVDRIQDDVDDLLGRVIALEGMIQSVTIVPAYSDGSVRANDGVLYLDIIVDPAEAVKVLTKDSLKVLVNEAKVKTKAVDVDTVTVTKFKVDAAKGTITARADISSKLPVASGKALTIAVNVKNGLSDFTTKFYPVEISTNVDTKEENDITKVTIKADEDFPGPVIGNIVVADGFKESKPTTIDVQGIGTVTFDKKATNKIRNNATQAGATSVLFKVEDVTTTKPVPNADVVLEVTMKTVDEQGTEVFCDGKADGEVTIQIPMDENVAYVNSVTLVDDDGDPIEGGVVSGSEEIENGILTFKVNHFSKYAIDYVTREEFVSVTGISLDKTSATVEVGDTLRLVATIAPEDATNKKVTWSSSDTTKVTVDNTGKIKAVAFGQATITVTTKDGGKTATCTVTVTTSVTPEGFVDLGVKDADGKPLYWAEKNLGASKAEEYGDYFAWGVTAPYYEGTGGWPATPTWKSGKASGYAWQSYCGSLSFVEWSTPPYDATSKILLPAYDAATAANSSWRTPTKDEFVALAANCVWIWTANYNSTGKAGYIVYKAKSEEDKGKANMNGTWKKCDLSKSEYVTDGASEATGYTTSDIHIFFPAAGNGNSTSLSGAGSQGYYWSSSFYTDITENAYSLNFDSSFVKPWSGSNRKRGFSVRPVTSGAAPAPALPTGALKGVFSVSATKKVHFSKGNLVATINATGAPTAWKFAANQYDCLGEGGANKTIGATAGDADLFGWSTDATSNNWGIHTKSSEAEGYTTGNFKDWGTTIDDKGTWRTLSTAEWQYLINQNGNENVRKGKYKYGVTVCGKENCLILAPDDFEGAIAESYDAAAWTSAEAAGLVCLPAAGHRLGTTNISYVGSVGYYWSSTAYNETYAYDVYFGISKVTPDDTGYRYRGYSVRLITESK